MDGGLTSSVNYSGWILYRARQACTPYVVLYALVDLRIVEVSNVHVHLIGSTEEFPNCRLWVGSIALSLIGFFACLLHFCHLFFPTHLYPFGAAISCRLLGG